MVYSTILFVFSVVFFSLQVSFSYCKTQGSSFTKMSFLKLDGSIIQAIAVKNILQCCWKCDRLPECFSLNVADVPDKDGLYECQMLRTETNKYSGLLKPSQHYHHYTRFMDKCETTKCLNGGTCETRGYDEYNCRCPNGFTGRICNVKQAEDSQSKTYKWLKTNTSPVCFGAKDSTFGSFNVKENVTVTTVKLVHLSGYVTCNSRSTASRSNWGCAPDENYKLDKILTIITDNKDQKILPQDEFITGANDQTYQLPGMTTKSPELTFQNFTTPMNVAAGQEYRIWYGQDLNNYTESNNGGKSCTDVYMFGFFGF